MIRKIIKAVVPDRILVSSRFALAPHSGVPLVAVPSINAVIQNLNALGYGRSIIEGAPVDQNGNPLPWYTYPMIEYLDSLDFSECRIFEYGCGNSTMWWGARSREVISVEDNQEWYDRVSGRINSRIVLETDPQRYVNAISGEFDLIIVDGSVRYECCLKAVNHLAAGGAILLDNADCLPRSTNFLRDSGLFEIAMNGFSPLASRGGRTSLFISQPSRLIAKPHRSSWVSSNDRWDESNSNK